MNGNYNISIIMETFCKIFIKHIKLAVARNFVRNMPYMSQYKLTIPNTKLKKKINVKTSVGSTSIFAINSSFPFILVHANWYFTPPPLTAIFHVNFRRVRDEFRQNHFSVWHRTSLIYTKTLYFMRDMIFQRAMSLSFRLKFSKINQSETSFTTKRLFCRFTF